MSTISETAKKDRPNILFILTDQESVSLSGCYGNLKIKRPAREESNYPYTDMIRQTAELPMDRTA